MTQPSPFFTPAQGQPQTAPEASGTETPVSAPTVSQAELDDLRSQLATLQAQIEASRPRPNSDSPVRENGAGIGAEVRGTWSQYDQELADAGIHPLQTAQPAPWVG